MREKAWERKMGVYAHIFEALHDMKKWYDAHLDAEIRGRELEPARLAELNEAYRNAKATLLRKLTSETWLLPIECSERIDQLEKALSKRHDMFVEAMEHGSYETQRAVEDLRKFTRDDLGIDRHSMPERIVEVFHSGATKLLKVISSLFQRP
jgi:hypothetical protein